MIQKSILDKLSKVPHTPGCYLMKNKDGVIIYVGKSKNLKNRLSSYFQRTHTGKTKKLVEDICTFDYIVTSSELESLLLEINLIKKYDPKYNIMLTDDKSYPYIELTNDKIPRLLVVRNPKISKKNNFIFGPYPNVTSARKTVELLNRLYPIRKCKNMGKEVCLYYHINECLGYCVNKNLDNEVSKMKEEIISFLNGNDKVVIDNLKEKMEYYSNKLDFEKALEYKNLLSDISTTLEKQKVELDDKVNRDVIGYFYKDNYLSISMLFIRGGKLLDKKSVIFSCIEEYTEELSNYIFKFYYKHEIRPKEVLVRDIDNNLFNEAFNIKFITPEKGAKKKMLDLACDNAKVLYNEKISLMLEQEESLDNSMKELASLLGLDKVSRIELFDNSNLFGSYNVSGMVVFINGRPLKNEYRKYKITNDVNDDYGTMREVIYRRYFKVLMEGLDRPDLILVDGGLGQINVCLEVLNSLNLDIPVAGLKKDDKHSTDMLLTSSKEIPLDKRSPLFLLLTRMQDEVHNYTISYHKNIRSKGTLASILDNIPKIGAKRKEKLLKKYKTISAMKSASNEELSEILPKNMIGDFKEYLNKNYND